MVDSFSYHIQTTEDKNALDIMTREIADQINKEILESILQSAEQTSKIMKISKTIMCEMEDKS